MAFNSFRWHLLKNQTSSDAGLVCSRPWGVYLHRVNWSLATTSAEKNWVTSDILVPKAAMNIITVANRHITARPVFCTVVFGNLQIRHCLEAQNNAVDPDRQYQNLVLLLGFYYWENIKIKAAPTREFRFKINDFLCLKLLIFCFHVFTSIVTLHRESCHGRHRFHGK